ncbi:hypothetical protein D299_gp003 [Escherichia phage HX01]|nr:hypothetical protein D299_gp003 [Escherichia phage HX01]
MRFQHWNAINNLTGLTPSFNK